MFWPCRCCCPLSSPLYMIFIHSVHPPSHELSENSFTILTLPIIRKHCSAYNLVVASARLPILHRCRSSAGHSCRSTAVLYVLDSCPDGPAWEWRGCDAVRRRRLACFLLSPLIFSPLLIVLCQPYAAETYLFIPRFSQIVDLPLFFCPHPSDPHFILVRVAVLTRPRCFHFFFTCNNSYVDTSMGTRCNVGRGSQMLQKI